MPALGLSSALAEQVSQGHAMPLQVPAGEGRPRCWGAGPSIFRGQFGCPEGSTPSYQELLHLAVNFSEHLSSPEAALPGTCSRASPKCPQGVLRARGIRKAARLSPLAGVTVLLLLQASRPTLEGAQLWPQCESGLLSCLGSTCLPCGLAQWTELEDAGEGQGESCI